MFFLKFFFYCFGLNHNLIHILCIYRRFYICNYSYICIAMYIVIFNYFLLLYFLYCCIVCIFKVFLSAFSLLRSILCIASFSCFIITSEYALSLIVALLLQLLHLRCFYKKMSVNITCLISC